MTEERIEEKVKKIVALAQSENNACKQIQDYFEQKLNNTESEEIINSIIDDLRDYYIENNSTMYHFKEGFYPELIAKVRDIVKQSLRVYDSFSIVRNTETEKAVKLLDDIFDNCILRVDYEYYEEVDIEEYGCSNKEILDLIHSFRLNVYDCIAKLMNEKSIRRSFEVNTGISSLLINSIVQNINSHYTDLRINYLIRMIRDA